ncbi:MAG: MarR family transcriptional regulator [Candidatus Eremiobacteraeota bacterium]|nr:MarR family transcriptional regulator [Candidatus Eremiobacteraeota bacterium]
MKKKRESSQAEEPEQLDAFIRELLFFDRQLSSLKHHSVTDELTEELHEYRNHLDTICRTGGSARRIENINIFFDICHILSSRQDPLTMGEISHLMNVPLSTATRLIDWIVENGFAKRLSDPDDRRVVRVSLTKEGIELYHALFHFMRQWAVRILVHFTEEEKSLLITLMNKFSGILARENIGSRKQAQRSAP